MTLRQQQLPGLYGGVSQQPPMSRLTHMMESQSNTLCDPVDELRLKRPPLKRVANLASITGTVATSFIKKMKTTSGDYILLVTDNSTSPVNIYKTDGTKCTVTPVSVGGVSPATYVTSGSSVPKNKLKLTNLLDYNFLLNTEVTPAKRTDASNKSSTTVQPCMSVGIINKIQYNASGSPAVTLTWTFTLADPAHSVTSATRSGTVTIGATDNPTTIATAITAAIASDATVILALDISITSVENVIIASCSSGSAAVFGLTLSDTWGNTLSKAFNSEVATVPVKHLTHSTYDTNWVLVAQKYTDLPALWLATAYRIKIIDETVSNIGYYVKWDTTGKCYKESNAPYIDTRYNENTFPVEIVQTAATAFTLQRFGYASSASANNTKVVSRGVGDDDSNPFGGILGRELVDLIVFRNRLCFVASDGILISQTDDYYNFFASTAKEVLDTDPIDFNVDASEFIDITHVVPFSEQVYLYGSKQQFLMHSYDSPLTPSTIQVDLVSNFSFNNTVAPVNFEDSVLFTHLIGSSISLMETKKSGITQSTIATKLNVHAPTFLSSGISTLVPCLQKNIILMPARNTNIVYVYQYQLMPTENGNQERIQSAFHSWQLNIRSQVIQEVIEINTDAYIIAHDTTTSITTLYKMSLDTSNKINSSLPFNIHLDATEEFTSGVYTSSTDSTMWLMSGGSSVGAQVILVSSGKALTIVGTGNAAGNIVASGDWSTSTVIIGLPFVSVTTLSEQVIRNPQTKLAVANVDIRIVRIYVDYINTGYFEITITPTGSRTTTSKIMNCFDLNSDIASLDYVLSLKTNQLKTFVLSSPKGTIQLKSSSHLPAQITGVTFEMDVIKL